MDYLYYPKVVFNFTIGTLNNIWAYTSAIIWGHQAPQAEAEQLRSDFYYSKSHSEYYQNYCIRKSIPFDADSNLPPMSQIDGHWYFEALETPLTPSMVAEIERNLGSRIDDSEPSEGISLIGLAKQSGEIF